MNLYMKYQFRSSCDYVETLSFVGELFSSNVGIISVWFAFWSSHWLWNICVTNDHRYVPLVVSTSRSFPHSWPITWFVTRVTRWVPLVEQVLLTLPGDMSSPPGFSGVRVTWSLVVYVCFVYRCLSFSTFFFFLAIVLSVLPRYTDYDYPFGIFKLFGLFHTYINLFEILKPWRIRCKEN